MSEYYRGNAIYDLIESTHNFRYTTENLWILVYGNRDCDPKVILLLSAYKNENYESKTLTPKESEIMIYTEQISHKSGVPFIYFRNDFERHLYLNGSGTDKCKSKRNRGVQALFLRRR